MRLRILCVIGILFALTGYAYINYYQFDVPQVVQSGTPYSVYITVANDYDELDMEILKDGEYLYHHYAYYENYVSWYGTLTDHGNKTVRFDVYCYDFGDGESISDTKYVQVYIPNVAPDSAAVSTSGVSATLLGQSIVLSGTLHDPDGNLVFHNLYYLAPGSGTWVPILGGTPSNSTASHLNTTFAPSAVGSWAFRSYGYDSYSCALGANISVSVLEPLNASLDSDGDGLPDSWEAAHFGTLQYNGTQDNDGDGRINYQELLLGTKPADPIDLVLHTGK